MSRADDALLRTSRDEAYRLGWEHGYRAGINHALRVLQCSAAGIDLPSNEAAPDSAPKVEQAHSGGDQ